MTLVKDEKYFDKFDQAFGAYFHGVATLDEADLRRPARLAEEAPANAISRRKKNGRSKRLAVSTS